MKDKNVRAKLEQALMQEWQTPYKTNTANSAHRAGAGAKLIKSVVTGITHGSLPL